MGRKSYKIPNDFEKNMNIHTVDELMVIYGVSVGTITKWNKTFVEKKPIVRRKARPSLKIPNDFEQNRNDHTVDELAVLCGVSVRTIAKWNKTFGERKPIVMRKGRPSLKIPNDFEQNRNNHTVDELAVLCGVSSATIRKWTKSFADRKPYTRRKINPNPNTKITNKQVVIDAYNKGRTQSDIARSCGVSPQRIHQIIVEYKKSLEKKL